MEHPVSIVTGAGSGIGRAIALALAQRGHRVVLVGRTERKLQETAAACAQFAPADAFRVMPADLSDAAAAHGVIDGTLEAFGQLDTLINCAGIAPLAPMEKTTDAMLADTFAHNTFAPAALMLRAWPHFRARRAGCIVNVSTIGTLDPFAGFFAYAASKSALDSFTRSAHTEGSKLGIRCFCINPGAVETPLLRQNFPASMLPESHTLAPEEVAAVVVECIEGKREEARGKPLPLSKQRSAAPR